MAGGAQAAGPETATIPPVHRVHDLSEEQAAEGRYQHLPGKQRGLDRMAQSHTPRGTDPLYYDTVAHAADGLAAGHGYICSQGGQFVASSVSQILFLKNP